MRHYIRAERAEYAEFDFPSEQVLLPEHKLRILKDSQPDEEMRSTWERDAQ